MFTVGSYNNPYSEDEFHYMNNNGIWGGGWVRSGYALSYYTRYLVRYFGNMKKNYPVSYVIYEEMYSKGYWEGGWVMFDSSLCYYTAFGNSYAENTGSQQLPWPSLVYEEMTHNGMWDGGWVLFDASSIQYVPELSISEGSLNIGLGSGFSIGYSGSGCNTGKKLGCKITAGSGIVGTLKNGAFQLDVNWTEGYTIGGNELSEVFYSLSVLNPSYTIVEVNLSSSWIEAYKASIEGSFSYEKDGGETHQCYICNGSITIPNDYHVDPDD